MEIFVLLLFIKITEISGGVNDIPLLNIYKIPNTNLFDGIAYQLKHPCNNELNLEWINDLNRFQFVKSESPPNDLALFYLVSHSGYIYIKNAALGDRTVVAKCIAGQQTNCILTTNDSEFPGESYYVKYAVFIPQPRGIVGGNVYRLDFQ